LIQITVLIIETSVKVCTPLRQLSPQQESTVVGLISTVVSSPGFFPENRQQETVHLGKEHKLVPQTVAGYQAYQFMEGQRGVAGF